MFLLIAAGLTGWAVLAAFFAVFIHACEVGNRSIEEQLDDLGEGTW